MAKRVRKKSKRVTLEDVVEAINQLKARMDFIELSVDGSKDDESLTYGERKARKVVTRFSKRKEVAIYDGNDEELVFEEATVCDANRLTSILATLLDKAYEAGKTS